MNKDQNYCVCRICYIKRNKNEIIKELCVWCGSGRCEYCDELNKNKNGIRKTLIGLFIHECNKESANKYDPVYLCTSLCVENYANEIGDVKVHFTNNNDDELLLYCLKCGKNKKTKLEKNTRKMYTKWYNKYKTHSFIKNLTISYIYYLKILPKDLTNIVCDYSTVV